MKNSNNNYINKKQLGNRIRSERTKLGLSLEQLGKKVDPPANKSIVSRWESGKSIPSNSRIISLASLFHTDSNSLVYGSRQEFILNVIRDNQSLYDYLNSSGLLNKVIKFIEDDIAQYSHEYLGNPEVVYQSLIVAMGYFFQYPKNDNDYIRLIITRVKTIKEQIINDKPVLSISRKDEDPYKISENKKKKLLMTMNATIASLNQLLT